VFLGSISHVGMSNKDTVGCNFAISRNVASPTRCIVTPMHLIVSLQCDILLLLRGVLHEPALQLVRRLTIKLRSLLPSLLPCLVCSLRLIR
jgi:hypothetical protein